jgi:hypothetical protein
MHKKWTKFLIIELKLLRALQNDLSDSLRNAHRNDFVI